MPPLVGGERTKTRRSQRRIEIDGRREREQRSQACWNWPGEKSEGCQQDRDSNIQTGRDTNLRQKCR